MGTCSAEEDADSQRRGCADVGDARDIRVEAGAWLKFCDLMNKPFEEPPTTQALMYFAAWRLEAFGGGVSPQTVMGDISVLGHCMGNWE